MIGIVDVAVVEPRGKNLGERGRWDKNDNQLQKGRLPRLCYCRLGGERRGEVASLSSSSLSRKDVDVGQREGRRMTTTISSLLSRGVGKDLGERVAGGRPMMARGERIAIFAVLVD